MKCPTCNGSGEIKHDWLPHETCHNCNGTGYVDMTNEEWLKQCTTEQLAEFIADVCYELVDDINANYDDTSCNYRQTEKDYWVEWLKQPHTTKEQQNG